MPVTIVADFPLHVQHLETTQKCAAPPFRTAQGTEEPLSCCHRGSGGRAFLWDRTRQCLLPLEPWLSLFTAWLLGPAPFPHLPRPVHFNLPSATITVPETSLAQVFGDLQAAHLEDVSPTFLISQQLRALLATNRFFLETCDNNTLSFVSCSTNNSGAHSAFSYSALNTGYHRSSLFSPVESLKGKATHVPTALTSRGSASIVPKWGVHCRPLPTSIPMSDSPAPHVPGTPSTHAQQRGAGFLPLFPSLSPSP